MFSMLAFLGSRRRGWFLAARRASDRRIQRWDCSYPSVWVLLAGVLLLRTSLADVVAAESLGGGFLLRSQMSDVELPLYVGADTQPAGIVRVDRVFTDYERHGFFRIGALPVLVLDGVTVELTCLDQARAALTQTQGWLGANNPENPGTNGGVEASSQPKAGRTSRRLDCRNLTIVIPGSVTNVVRAGRAKIAADGQLELTENVRVEGMLSFQTRQARLQMSGPMCGELTWEAQDGTAMTYNLLRGFGMKKASPG